MSRPTYAGIGSRDTPEEVLSIQFRLGRALCDAGWHGMSGECHGSDMMYHEGARQSPRYKEVGFTAIIPWEGFEGCQYNPEDGIIDLRHTKVSKRAMWLGIGARGTDAGLKKGGILLHTRNALQILGLDLKHPVRFVSCWAKPLGKQGHVQGGTGTAVALAIHMGIPVINLYTEEGLKRAMAFLDSKE